MSNSRRNAITAIAFLVNLVPNFVAAQSKHSNRKGEFYFSWGITRNGIPEAIFTLISPSLVINIPLKTFGHTITPDGTKASLTGLSQYHSTTTV